uniref:Chondroitin proteoglycan 4 domain-containing protein n=1 Tax=Parascaris univalens TaxID=6257 RepID=A0A915A9I0_PARUN
MSQKAPVFAQERVAGRNTMQWKKGKALQVATESKEVLLHSTVEGVQVRQCSCDEQRECTGEMREQAMECIGACWSQFRQASSSFTTFRCKSLTIMSHPEYLKSCFDEKDDLLRSFLTCFEKHVDSCVHSEVGPLIPKVNISELFRLGERAITHNADNLGRTTPKALRRILDVAGDFFICVKDCFLERNKNGFCFDESHNSINKRMDKLNERQVDLGGFSEPDKRRGSGKDDNWFQEGDEKTARMDGFAGLVVQVLVGSDRTS